MKNFPFLLSLTYSYKPCSFTHTDEQKHGKTAAIVSQSSSTSRDIDNSSSSDLSLSQLFHSVINNN